MTTKTPKTPKTQMPQDFQEAIESWEEVTNATADQLLVTAQKSFDQAMALQERMMNMWLDSFKRLQDLSIRESEAAYEVAEKLQDQMKAAAERASKMMTEA
jgi:Cdc6-like AAA superfamily ATPase